MNKEELIEYYKKYPEKFCKDILEIDLLPYQITLLKLLIRKKNFKKYGIIKYYN